MDDESLIGGFDRSVKGVEESFKARGVRIDLSQMVRNNHASLYVLGEYRGVQVGVKFGSKC
jgi:hypothetical protein